MRILVTGGSNPYGQAIVRALVQGGHQVRVFGGSAQDVEAIGAKGPGALTWFPGDVKIGGSMEPALSERQALVHVAGMDPPSDRHALHIERGAKYARYAAEREQVDDFILVAPDQPPRAYAKEHAAAVRECDQVRGTINHVVVRAGPDANAVANEVVRQLGKLPELGKQPGRENDAVTA